MKGTIFAVALNHRSQLDAWREAFQQAPYKTPPKTAVWFIKPRNTVIGDGESIPYPQGETVQSGATVALIVGKTARKVAAEDAAAYIAGYALANDVSLPEESFYRPAIKAKCRDGFCPLGALAPLSDVDNRRSPALRRRAAERPERIRHPQSRRCDSDRYAPLPRYAAPRRSRTYSRRGLPGAGKPGD